LLSSPGALLLSLSSFSTSCTKICEPGTLQAAAKLQNLVARGAVKKNGKKYKGLPAALANAIAQQNGHLAGVR